MFFKCFVYCIVGFDRLTKRFIWLVPLVLSVLFVAMIFCSGTMAKNLLAISFLFLTIMYIAVWKDG